MPFIMNASSVEQSVQVHGSWFSFKAKQIKEMNEAKSAFLTSTKGYLGFVALPDEASDLDWRSTKEGKAEIESAERNGIENRIRHLEWLRSNEQKSLRKDMDKVNMKSEVAAEWTDSSYNALKAAAEELATYKKSTDNKVEDRTKKIKDLEAALGE
jgi:primosomal protein N'